MCDNNDDDDDYDDDVDDSDDNDDDDDDDDIFCSPRRHWLVLDGRGRLRSHSAVHRACLVSVKLLFIIS